MTEQVQNSTGSPWIGVGLITTYLFASLAWIIALSSLLVLQAIQSGMSIEAIDSAALFEVIGPLGFSFQSFVQSFGFVAISATLVISANRWLPSSSYRSFSAVYGFRNPPRRFILIGLVGGLLVGIFPGWLIEVLKRLRPDLDLGTIDLINQLFNVSNGVETLALVAVLVIIAPITEELVFRGFLWNSCQRFLNPVAVWLLTSLLFSVYHMSLVQSVALLFTGSFIGLLRWTSRSIWPAIAAHFSNNLLATIVVLSGALGEEGAIPWWSACFTGLLTLGLCLYAWRTRMQEP